MKVLISILRIWLTFRDWKIHLLLWFWNNSKANLSKRFRTYLIAKKDKTIKIIKELPKRKPVLLERFQLKPGSTWFTYTLTLSGNVQWLCKKWNNRQKWWYNRQSNYKPSGILSQKYLKNWFIFRSILL